MDLFFGTIGLLIGLLVAYLVTIPLSAVKVQVISQVLPFFITILLGYYGFLVWFRRREEFSNLLTKKEKRKSDDRSEEHTSELQSRFERVCRLLQEKKKNRTHDIRLDLQ